MPTTTTDNRVAQKTRELCEAILDQSQSSGIRRRIDAFLSDPQARQQYETVMNRGQSLQEKQRNSIPLDGPEIAEFEKQRDVLLDNPVARGFLDAQEELHQLQHSIQKQLAKTLELGRLPTEADLAEGGCGSGCGCHQH